MRLAPRNDCYTSSVCVGRRSVTGTSMVTAERVTLSVTSGPVCPEGTCPRTSSTDFAWPVGGLWKPCGQAPDRSVIGRSGRPALVEPSNHPDQLALDPNVVVELRRIRLVRRLKPDAVLLLEEPLEGHSVLLDLGDHDVAVPGGRLGSDENEVAVRDVGIDHRVAPNLEHVRVAGWRQHVRDPDRLRRVLVGLDGSTRGDLTDDRQDVRLHRDRLGHELSSETEPDRRVRREPDRARLGCAPFEIAVALQDLQVMVDGGRGGEADRLRDLPDRRRKAPRSQRRCDEIQDPDLSVRIVLGHRRLLVLATMIPNGRSMSRWASSGDQPG